MCIEDHLIFACGCEAPINVLKCEHAYSLLRLDELHPEYPITHPDVVKYTTLCKAASKVRKGYLKRKCAKVCKVTDFRRFLGRLDHVFTPEMAENPEEVQWEKENGLYDSKNDNQF